MLWIHVLLLQVALVLAPNPGLYQRKNRHRYSRYSPPKRQETALSIYPRCRSEPTVLDIFVIHKSGSPSRRSKLWISSSTGMREALTDVNGEAKVEVTGCQIGVIVWKKGKQSTYTPVALEGWADKVKKVVVEIDAACNFIVRARMDNTYGQKADRIHYLVNSGGSTTSGSFISGPRPYYSPLCVPVKNGDSLYMVVTVQGSDYPNILYLTKVKEGSEAWLTVPYPMKFLSRDLGGGDFSIMVISNVWELTPSRLKSLDSIKLQASNREHSEHDAEWTTSLIYRDFGKKSIYIVAIKFRIFGPNPTVQLQLKGNAVLYDKEGNMKIIEYPDQQYTRQSHWILGCFRGCLNTFKERSEIVEGLPRTEDEIKEYCNMY